MFFVNFACERQFFQTVGYCERGLSTILRSCFCQNLHHLQLSYLLYRSAEQVYHLRFNTKIQPLEYDSYCNMPEIILALLNRGMIWKNLTYFTVVASVTIYTVTLIASNAVYTISSVEAGRAVAIVNCTIIF